MNSTHQEYNSVISPPLSLKEGITKNENLKKQLYWIDT